MNSTQSDGSNLPVNGNGHASIVDVRLQALYYGSFKAVRDTNLTIKRNTVTAFIGPSGCGKSTVLRSINRMNDLVRGFRFVGPIPTRRKHILAGALRTEINAR